MTSRVNFRLPEELVTKADVAARVTHRNRTEVVREALQSYLDEVEDSDEYREAVVELYLDDEVDYDLLTAVIGRRDAEAVRASKELLDGGEELASELADR
jgi:metal-responsive CopG/Arc/MetJ family transcriptional regulator